MKAWLFFILLVLTTGVDSKELATLDLKLSELIPADEPGCSIGVFEKGEPILRKGYGLANLELNVPMTTNNVHRMASVSKQFVAMAVLLLADQGKLELDQDIRTYIDGLPDYGHTVTVNSVIGHTAGMGDYGMISSYGAPDDYQAPKGSLDLKAVSGRQFRIGNEDYLTVSEFHELVKQLPLVIEPNKTWQYSNMGYVLLAILVEEVSGKTLRQFSQEFIFEPLGMTSTFFADNATEIVPHRAYGYSKNEQGEYINNMTNLFWVGDGGLHTNIDDMQKWDRQFYQTKLGNNPDELMRMFMQANTQIPVDPESDDTILYANGQFVRSTERGMIASHSGGWLGANIQYNRYVDQEFMNLVMCSNVSVDSSKVAETIKDWYFN
jgi:CubicO group peptidase (beta-lactamase class C family)